MTRVVGEDPYSPPNSPESTMERNGGGIEGGGIVEDDANSDPEER